MSLLTVSLLGFSSVGVNAEWRQSNNNSYYYYTDGTKATNTIIDGKYVVGVDGSLLQDNNNNIPITVPSSWIRLTNNGYEMTNQGHLEYLRMDLNEGAPYDKAILTLGSILIQNKKNSDFHTNYQKYNGYEGTKYEYTETELNGRISKCCMIIIPSKTRLYLFSTSGYNDYKFDLNKNDLESTLNTTLKL